VTLLRLEKGWRIVSKTYLRVEDSEAQATLHPDSSIFCAAAHCRSVDAALNKRK
jgi:hypothetical protein